MRKFLDQVKSAPGREHEQAFIRIAIGIIIFMFVILTHLDDPDVFKRISIQVIIYTLCGFLLLAWIYKNPTKNPLRYVVSSTIDITALSYLMFYSGEMSEAFFGVYLWIIFGFGFRFGSLYLFIASAQSVIGLTVVYLTSFYWSEHPSLFYSILVCLIILPTYLSTLLQRLKQSIEKANIANDAKTQFLANMTHELRTPLNGIFCSNDLLKTTTLTSTQEEYVDSIEYSVNMLLTVINDVLDLSKIESGKFESINEDFDLHALLNSVVMMLKNHAQEKGLELHLHVMPDVPFSLHGDKTHTLQVLINIVGNAIKYTDKGHVKINTYLVTREEKRCCIRFEIEDTGIGIPKEKQKALFERFSQVDNTDTREHEGSGLGTTIAKGLVEKLGGTIGVDSTVGKGSIFHFELLYQVRWTDKSTDEGLKNVRVLLLRDKENSLVDVYQDLNNWKVRTIDSFTARDTLNIIEQDTKKDSLLHAIIIAKSTLDINIIEFTKSLKNKNILDNINLIIINSDINEEDKKAMIESGVDYILPPAVEKSILYNSIHSAPMLIPKDKTIKVFSHHKNNLNSKSIKILVAEDNSANQFIFERGLSNAGFEVTIANNGEEALDKLTENSYDLCIMDMQMPVMSGVQAIQLFRFVEPDSTLPFIILTANATQEAAKACLDTGAEAYLTKPIRMHVLFNTIHSLVNTIPKDQDTKNDETMHHHSIIDYEQISTIKDIDTFKKLAKIFKNNLLANVEKIKVTIEKEDYKEFKSILHKLKGTSGSFGATQLYRVIVEIDKLSHSEFLKCDSEKITHITKEIDIACQALQNYSATLLET